MKQTNNFFYQQQTPAGLVAGKEITISTKFILQEAQKLGIKWREIPGTRVLELSYKNQIKHFYNQVPQSTSLLGHFCTSSKQRTRQLLKDKEISVSKGYIVNKNDSQDLRQQVWQSLEKPVVVKPDTGTHGDSVFLNISTKTEFQQALTKVFSEYENASIEEMFIGIEFRVLATNDKVLGITQRVPANVTGDGISTIQQLIDQKNADPRRAPPYKKALITIEVDEHVRQTLNKIELSLISVPTKTQQVFLRENSNLSTGGDSIDMTDVVHPTVKSLAIKAMNAIPGLPYGGVDFMTTNVEVEQKADSYIIIEINASPGLFMHDKPFVGKNRHTAREFLKLLFPELES